MRITFILPTANLSGGIKVVAIYARALAERGHTVFAISQPAEKTPLKRKLKSFILGKGWPSAASRAPSPFGEVNLNHSILDCCRPVTDDDVPDADVVIATWWETAEWVHDLGASKGAKVYFIQGHEIYADLPIERVKATYHLPLHKITVSRWLKDLLRDVYGEPSVDLVPNSVDRAKFLVPKRGRQNTPSVGFLFHTGYIKGADVVIAALAKLRQMHPNLRAICFGQHKPSRQLTLDDWIEFHHSPSQEQIRDVYAQCDVWISASRSEGFNLTAMEAMACRTPVVSTRTGWPVEAIKTNNNGVLVDVNDVDALADGAAWVLSLPDEEWRRVSQCAYSTVASSSWESSVDLFEQALQSARLNQENCAVKT